MPKSKLNFGTIKMPVNEQIKQSCSYTSIEWKVLIASAKIKLEPPTYGNPLLKEVRTKNYSAASFASH